MIKSIRLINFKSFRDATVHLGPFSVLIGTNASGKSNLRDALRFLHGIGRDYSVADIIGGKYGESGERIWSGIRGGPREIVFAGEKTFALEIEMVVDVESIQHTVLYHIEVSPGDSIKPVSIVSEWMYWLEDDRYRYLFRYNGHARANEYDMNTSIEVFFEPSEIDEVDVTENKGFFGSMNGSLVYREKTTNNLYPIAGQFIDIDFKSKSALRAKQIVRHFLAQLGGIRFLDPHPESMRQPSFSGQNILTDQGANLSSVLLQICTDPQRKETLVNWLQALTPMDAADFEFPPDQIGRVLVTLVEHNGRKTSAYSASDGTLRFLAILAALLGSDGERTYFFEELDNGIHPTRLHLLIQLIEQQSALRATQVITTTHSPQLLRLLSPKAFQAASIVYRLPEQTRSQIKRLADIPDIQRVLAHEDPARLFDSGWFEDALVFSADGDGEDA